MKFSSLAGENRHSFWPCIVSQYCCLKDIHVVVVFLSQVQAVSSPICTDQADSLKVSRHHSLRRPLLSTLLSYKHLLPPSPRLSTASPQIRECIRSNSAPPPCDVTWNVSQIVCSGNYRARLTCFLSQVAILCCFMPYVFKTVIS